MDLPPLKPDRKSSATPSQEDVLLQEGGDGTDSVRTASRSSRSNSSRGLLDPPPSPSSPWTPPSSHGHGHGSSPRLPNYKDQVRPDGYHSSHEDREDRDSATSTTIIPLADRVYVLSADEDEETASARLRLAAALRTESLAVDSKNSVGSYGPQRRDAHRNTGPPLLPIIPDSIQHDISFDDDDHESISAPTRASNNTAPATKTISSNTGTVAPGTSKHLIWAGALVFVVVVVAVATIVGINLAGGNGDPSTTSSSSTQTDNAPQPIPTATATRIPAPGAPPATTNTASPTVTKAPIPMSDSDGSTTTESPAAPPQSPTISPASPIAEQTPTTSTTDDTDDQPPPTLPPSTLTAQTKAPVTPVAPTRGPVLRTDAPVTTAPTTSPVDSPTTRAPTPTKRPTVVAPVVPGSVPLDTSKEVKLVASDGVAGDGFGVSVAISGDVMAVGAYHHASSSVEDSGAVYIYERTSANDWTLQAKLKASDGAGLDIFGYSVAVSGRTVVVGAYQDDTSTGFDSGSVYVFTGSSSTGRWNQQAHLVANDGAGDDRLGFSVAVDGETIVAGASGDKSFQGSAYVFVNSDNDGWTNQAKLTVDAGLAQDFFGTSVGISGDTIVVGAVLSDNTSDLVNTGSAHVYVRSGDVWTEQARLTSSYGNTDDNYGTSVAIDGETIVVGARQDDTDMGTNSGSVFVYSRTGDVWSEQTQLLASGGAADDNFGASVSISSAAIVVGAAGPKDASSGTYSGSAYVYFLSEDDGWTEQSRLTASDGATNDAFGVSVSISAAETTTTVVVGAHQVDTENGADSGAVYVY